jgi:hypothetical protein
MGFQSSKVLKRCTERKKGTANAALLFRVTSRPFAVIFLRFLRLFAAIPLSLAGRRRESRGDFLAHDPHIQNVWCDGRDFVTG